MLSIFILASSTDPSDPQTDYGSLPQPDRLNASREPIHLKSGNVRCHDNIYITIPNYFHPMDCCRGYGLCGVPLIHANGRQKILARIAHKSTDIT